MGALSILSAGAKQAPKAVKAKPLVSKFDEALANIQRPKGTGNEFLTEVMKQAGVKKAEVEDRKLRQAFEKAGKITKEQAQEIARKNANPKIEERVLIDQGDKSDELEKIAEREYGQPYDDLPSILQDIISEEFDAAAAKYGEYRLPGGSNYREILLKLPAMPDSEKERLMTLEARYRRLPQGAQYVFEESAEGREMKALKDKAEQAAYYSSHFGKDEPNILAHMRVQDRVGPNGEKILHVEEIQSDWHQAGRKKGYQQEVKPRNLEVRETDDGNFGVFDLDKNNFISAHASKDSAENYLQRTISEKPTAVVGVPDAPFKKNWHELAMKRLINHASENGYDKIAITPGAEQASRYDLSKQIDNISVTRGVGIGFNIEATDKNGRVVMNEHKTSLKDLDQYIGKEMANRVLNDFAEKSGDQHNYSGVDLQVGGEGMKGFYDKMLPDYLNTLGKKYGTQVGQFDIDVPDANADATEVVMKKTPLHSFDITPQLREEVTTKGLPLYQQIGLPIGAGTAASELELPEYAEGGAVDYNTVPDMNDGGAIIQGAPYKRGGKVKITDNLDEMFMEVNNKKFQRK
jgi:hypothetical protein